ncbi:unnamed protein product [Effrenium voratum]|uniref:Uncharacterized protein n=1 Tax=Effrenium voratum TaxID=2562239 RepID=A0AA36I054_9DINO|nr:unnamed protein product [Effrenium voratum]
MAVAGDSDDTEEVETDESGMAVCGHYLPPDCKDWLKRPEDEVQYQYEGNVMMVYAILRQSQVFQKIGTLSIGRRRHVGLGGLYTAMP